MFHYIVFSIIASFVKNGQDLEKHNLKFLFNFFKMKEICKKVFLNIYCFFMEVDKSHRITIWWLNTLWLNMSSVHMQNWNLRGETAIKSLHILGRVEVLERNKVGYLSLHAVFWIVSVRKWEKRIYTGWKIICLCSACKLWITFRWSFL